MKKFFLIFCFLNFFFSLNAKILLDDSLEMEEYLNDFPYQQYQIYEVPSQGLFYVEPNLNDTIKNVLRSGKAWEPHLLPIIRTYAKKGSVVVDIGAHVGTFANFMAKRVGRKGRVHAFEPQKKLYRELVYNCLLNQNQKIVIPHRSAIGNEHKVIEMDLYTYPGSEGSTSIGKGGDFAEMFTLDHFHLKNVSLIKIDVERNEDLVLDGMINTLKRNKPVIIIELQGGYLWESAPPDIKEKMISSISKLENLGYKVTRIYLHDYLALPTKVH